MDASRAPQKILHSHEQIPVRPGPLVLYYAKWIPGEHMPDGPIGDVAGLKFTAKGKTIPWRRDLVDMFAFHLEIPAGVESLDADFDFLLSAPASGYSAGASATAELDVLSWNQSAALSAGSFGSATDVCAEPAHSGRVEIRDGAAWSKTEGRRNEFCTRSAEHWWTRR